MPISTERTEKLIEVSLRENGAVGDPEPLPEIHTQPWAIPPLDELIDHAIIRFEPRGVDPEHSLLRFTRRAVESETVLIDCTE